MSADFKRQPTPKPTTPPTVNSPGYSYLTTGIELGQQALGSLYNNTTKLASDTVIGIRSILPFDDDDGNLKRFLRSSRKKRKLDGTGKKQKKNSRKKKK